MICQLVHSLNYGGAECLARDFAMHAAKDHRFVFACLDQAGPMEADLASAGFNIQTLARRPGFDVACAWRLARYCRQHDVRLLHAHQYTPFFYASLASRMAGSIPVLFTEHGREYPDRPRPKRMVANRCLLRARDRVVAVGNGVRTSLVRNEAITHHAIQVIPNGIETDRFAVPVRSREEVRAELSLDADATVIVHVARLDSLKDHPTAFRALAQLQSSKSSTSNLCLVLVGDGDERNTLVQLADQLGISPAVRFLGARSDVPDLLHAADLFLLSSLSEGIPLTLLEAMAAGLPCVATDVGGVSEVIEDRKTGLLAEAGNPASLAQQLSLLIGSETLRHAIAITGQRHVRDHFDARTMHNAYDKLYREMLAPRWTVHPPSPLRAPISMRLFRQARSTCT